MFLKIKNTHNIGGTVEAPPSKSYSHRAIIISSFTEGTSKIYNPLISEDTEASIKACKCLGAKIKYIKNEDKNYLEITGTEKIENFSKKPIDLKNSGTTLRVMTSIAGLSKNKVLLTGDSSLKNRPMETFLNALKPLGIKVKSLKNNGKPPIVIESGLVGGKTSIEGNVSSQFISSILMSGAITKNGVELEVTGEFVSRPYIKMTLDVMEKFGVYVEVKSSENEYLESENNGNDSMETTSFIVKPQKYHKTEFRVEGDYTSASYILSAIAILGGEVTIKNLFKESKQGDKLILDILKNMGADIIVKEDYVKLTSNGKLNGIDINLSNAPDLLPTVAVLGSLAKGNTKITGVKHGRFKETDRIKMCVSELRALKCDVKEYDNGMEIIGGVNSGIVDSHKDHRLAMAFSLIGLKYEVLVENGEVFNVSFPNFIEAMSEIGVDFELHKNKLLKTTN
ncbi:MAG: 3-phosphoshikimate 1-carboxyvinyltransferase [Methanobrevibacter sp.]|jgi:3-phosphoshikimate 1-carboxyvinyltransferase|nr:3-phosphoshikimate 1-carboxyvinyltransferase [Candidatus Methanovirga procula]